MDPELLAGVTNVEPTFVNKTGTWRYITPIKRDKIAPCHVGCPVSGDIAKWIGFVKEGKWGQAYEIVTKKNALPATTGRICYHPCEDKCNRSYLDKAVNIHYIERALGDWGLKNYHSYKNINKDFPEVAVIGSGPAGLNCAYQLVREGFPVTVFESRPEPGGMLAWAIPAYRLPPEILKAEIELVKAAGVDIKTGLVIGHDEFNDLAKQYAAVFVCTGASKGVPLPIEGTDKQGVYDAVDFMACVAGGRPVPVGKSVFVIGGGNAAIDSARVAVRLGASSVRILYRRTRQDMPAFPEEVAAGEAEGVEIVFQVSPLAVLGQEVVKGLRVIRTRFGKGRDSEVEVVPGSEEEIPVDSIIMATGQRADAAFVERCGVVTDPVRGTIKLGPCGDERYPGLFAGGDVVRGPATIAEALADGYSAAQAIRAYLKGQKRDPWQNEDRSKVITFEELNSAYFPCSFRNDLVPQGFQTKSALLSNFKEINKGLTTNEARMEAEYCLSCGNCNKCGNCWVFCPDVAIEYSDDYKILLDYCKGCGICASECPRGVITMEANR